MRIRIRNTGSRVSDLQSLNVEPHAAFLLSADLDPETAMNVDPCGPGSATQVSSLS